MKLFFVSVCLDFYCFVFILNFLAGGLFEVCAETVKGISFLMSMLSLLLCSGNEKGMSMSFVLFHFLLTLRFLPPKIFSLCTQLLCNERVQAINCFCSLFLPRAFQKANMRYWARAV